MAFHTYKIEHFGKTETGAYESTGTELTDILAINVSLILGESADSFSFSILNYDDNQLNYFKVDDNVKIYGSMDGTNYTLLLDGIINQKQNTSNLTSKTVNISGLNRLEKLFNSLISTTGEGVQRTASYWIKHILYQVNLFNKFGGTDREILYNDTTVTPTTYLIDYRKGLEKAFKLIEELSQDQYTDDGQYIYYLDTDNYFHWKPKSLASTSELEYGNQILTHRTQKGMYELINYIIMNCGKSPYGATILQMDYNVQSINKYGWKVKLISRESIANELRQQDQDKNYKPEYWDDGAEFPNAYPYTTVWGEVVADDGEYNSSFVDVCLATGKLGIGALLEQTTGATYKVDLSVEPSFAYVLGDVHSLKIPDNFWTSPQDIRLNSINYSFGTGGWKTDIKFKEDSELTAQ